MERAERDGVPAFLETAIPGNLPFYRRLGFELVEEGNAPNGLPHGWFLRRDGT